MLKKGAVPGGLIVSAGICAAALGARSFNYLVRHDVDAMAAKATSHGSRTVTEGMLESMPPPERRHLTYAGVVGNPIARAAHLAQGGRMRLGPGQPWLSVRAKQYYSAQPPGYIT